MYDKKVLIWNAQWWMKLAGQGKDVVPGYNYYGRDLLRASTRLHAMAFLQAAGAR